MIVLWFFVCEVGGFVKVVKNCFVKFVFKGIDFEYIFDLFQGLIVFVYFDDLVVVLKVVVDFVKVNDKLEIFGGVLGMINLNLEGVKFLVIMLLFDELCVKLVGMIQILVFWIVQVVNVLVGQFVCVFNVYVEKDEVV